MHTEIIEQFHVPLPHNLAVIVLTYADLIGFGKRSVRWVLFENGRRKKRTTRRKRMACVSRKAFAAL